MINFELQNHMPLRELVYEELKKEILTGRIAPGTRMMEVDLADEMGVSRTPVREAIRKLELEGREEEYYEQKAKKNIGQVEKIVFKEDMNQLYLKRITIKFKKF